MSFDERDAARAGISNLTGETVRTKATCEKESWKHGATVNPSIMSEAGYGTVELLAPVLWSCRFLDQQLELRPQNNVKRAASRRARLAVWCSSLTRGTSGWDRWQAASADLVSPPTRLLA